MIIPDANLLIYAYSSTSDFHSASKAWWEDCMTGMEPIGIPQVVLFACVRVLTNSRLAVNPIPISRMATLVDSWLERPGVEILTFDAADAQQTLSLLRHLGAAGNLATDAQIAASALRYGGVVHTMDADFARFPGVRWYNPLANPRRR